MHRVVRPILHPVVLAKIEIVKKGGIASALKQAGCAEICIGKKYGGNALPINRVTNAECFLPFGGEEEALSPNDVEKWNADVIMKMCERGNGDGGENGAAPSTLKACTDNYYQTWRSGRDFTPSLAQVAFEEMERKRLRTEIVKRRKEKMGMFGAFLLVLVGYGILAVWITDRGWGGGELWGWWGKEL